jgi:hypothetical protein
MSSPIDMGEPELVLEPVAAQASRASVIPGADVTLAIGELIQDANGEVVLFNDSQLRSLALSSDAHLVAEGMADQHVTAAGDDVSGYKYMTFANGLTLYFDPGLDVIVKSGEV